MTLFHEYDGTILTNRVQLGEEKGFSAHALLGEADSIHVLVDDPSMNLTITGHKRWRMIEDACPVGNQVVWRGYVGEKLIGRGSGTTFPFGRRWDVELIEDNTTAGLRCLTTATADRPAETVSARITWLLTTPGFSGVIVDRGLVQASAVTLDAHDYRPTQTGADVLRDCSLASGYNFFLRYREATDDLELAFYLATSRSLDTSTFRVTNAGDADFVTTWPAGYDTQLGQSPARVAPGIVLPFRGGYVYRTSTATEDAFGPRDLVAPSATVKSAATATTLADRLLTQHDEEDERITGLRLQLPAANLNDVKAGQLISAKLIHLPGFSAYRSCRVTSKAFGRPPNDSQAVYDVDLDLSPLRPSCYALDNDGNTITNTTDGFHPANFSPTSRVDGLIEYCRPSRDPTTLPDPYFAGDWFFATYNVGPGSYDVMGDNAQNFFRVFIVGPGTVVIHLIGGTSLHTNSALQYWNGSSIVTIESQLDRPQGDITFVVPDDGNCVHWVEVSEASATSGIGLLLTGFDWTNA